MKFNNLTIKYQNIIALFLMPFFYYSILNCQEFNKNLFSVINTGISSRALSLGQSSVASPDDGTAIFWNPAGLDRIQYKGINFYYSKMSPRTTNSYLGIFYPTISIGGFGIGWIQKRFRRKGINDIEKKFLFLLNEYLLSYGKEIFNNFYIGSTFKILDFDSDKKKSSRGIDIGFLYHHLYSENFLFNNISIGLNFQNLIHTKIKMSNEEIKLPLNIKFGILKPLLSNEWGNYLNLLLDLDKDFYYNIYFRDYHIGIEYIWLDLLELRIGLDNGRYTFGMGAKYNSIRFDYHYGKIFDGLDYSKSHHFSLTLLFGKSKRELIRRAKEKRYLEYNRIALQQVEFERNYKITKSMERGKTYLKDEEYARALREFNFIISFEKEMPNAAVIKEAKKLIELTTQKKIRGNAKNNTRN